MRNPYEELGLVDRPFNPSGLPPVVRRYVTMGLDKEISEVMKAVDVFLRGSDNILLVVIGPYGFGKSDLLDDIEDRLRNRGVEVIRVALSLSMNTKDYLINRLMRRDSSKPMVIMFDEADELTRAVSISGGVNDDVKRAIMQITSLIRAILEPRSYAALLNLNPSNLSRIMIIAAFTPQLYYNILRNHVPDVFDVARGRVFREVIIDDRVPYWLYESIVTNRLLSYSTQERLKAINEGRINPLWPLNRELLSFIYLVARRMENGQVSPRNLIKLTSKLFEMVAENKGSLNVDLALKFALSELAKYINVNLLNELRAYGDELLSIALSGIPVKASPSVELTGFVERVKVVEVNPDNPNELRRINNVRMIHGKPPIIIDDLRNLSIEYASYYTIPTDKGVKLFVILPHDSNLEGFISYDAYILKKNIHDKLLGLTGTEGSDLDELSNFIRQVATIRPIDVASKIISIITRGDVAKTHDALRVAIIDNVLDARLAYIATDDLGKVINVALNCGVKINGQVKYVDGLVAIIVNEQALTSQLSGNLNVKWCSVYDASQRILLLNYGSDNIEELRNILIGLYVLSKFSKIPSEYSAQVQSATKFTQVLGNFRDSLRNQLLQYTLGLPRRKEGKRDMIMSIVESWIENKVDQQIPQAFKCGDKPCISKVELTLINYLSNIGKPIDEKELEQVIRGIFPVQLWREFREHDLIELMRLRGLLHEHNGKYILTTSGNFSKVIEDTCLKIRELGKVLNNSITISVNNINLTLQTGLSSLQGELRALEDECKLLTAVISNPSEDDLKKLARINLKLIDIQRAIDEATEKESNLVKDIKATISNLNSLIGEVSKLEANVSNELKDVIKSRISRLRENISRAIGNLNGLSIDKAHEALRVLSENVGKEVNRLRSEIEAASSILTYAHEYSTIVSTLSRINQLMGSDHNNESINNANNELELIDSIAELIDKDDLEDLEMVMNEYENRTKGARAKLIDAVGKLKPRVAEIANSINWLRYRRILNQDLNVPNLDSTNLSELRANVEELLRLSNVITSKLSELSSKINIPMNVLMYIASRGPNVGLNEEAMARELGVSVNEVINYLELLWRMKLVDKRYVS